jgi:hypothetical protein
VIATLRHPQARILQGISPDAQELAGNIDTSSLKAGIFIRELLNVRLSVWLAISLMASVVNAQDTSLIPAVYVAPRYIAAEDAPSNIQIAGADEPGTRLVVTGQVIDGQDAIAGASVFVFHTDANGEYAPGVSGPDAELNPRLYGALRYENENKHACHFSLNIAEQEIEYGIAC